ncbi:chorismate mutase [Clostridium fallax]|uniref:chorismate mutase n=1 Tax=Clostridium fallax TaxID=1533 RepID=A0A1M4XGG0_9CLOT|nr:chorismate mutase [Clostridium fallax]SHE92518.1 chorismate mutase [Clostridium fallax]SQB06408.1 chorismate mutase [Clostridium fallax]
MIALRGATTILNNSEEDIKTESIKLFNEIIKENNLDLNKIISIIFSCTDDIDKEYPGKFIRENFDIKYVSIMHFNEMKVNKPSYLPMCIRLSIYYNDTIKQENVKHIYLNEAKVLRKDLVK